MQQQDEDRVDTSTDDAALFDHYGRAIFGYLRLHTTSREDAEDLTAEVFTAALENDQLSGLRHEEQLAWLRRVAYRKLVDSYRRAQRRSVVSLDQGAEMLLDEQTAAPEQVALQREAYRNLHQAVDRLPPLQQQVLRLRYGNGLHCAEIALLLNKREEAVRKLISRTLAQLRSIYNHTPGGRP